MNNITLGIFDDHPIVSGGLQAFLAKERDLVTVLFCENTRAKLLDAIENEMPDILVLDIVAADVNGLDLFEEILSLYPDAKIIAYSTLKSTILVENLLSIGVKGFVNKSQSPSDLLTAIIGVHRGNIEVPEKYKFLTSKFRTPQARNLTKREIEIIALIAQEATTQEIAEKLGVSTKTVENHKSNIFNKLEVKNAAGLILVATRLGYLS